MVRKDKDVFRIFCENMVLIAMDIIEESLMFIKELFIKEENHWTAAPRSY